MAVRYTFSIWLFTVFFKLLSDIIETAKATNYDHRGHKLSIRKSLTYNPSYKQLRIFEN